MGENSLRVDQAMFERYKTFCILGCSNASEIDCIPQDAITRNDRFYTTVIDLVAYLWKVLGGYSALFPLANCSFHYI